MAARKIAVARHLAAVAGVRLGWAGQITRRASARSVAAGGREPAALAPGSGGGAVPAACQPDALSASHSLLSLKDAQPASEAACDAFALQLGQQRVAADAILGTQKVREKQGRSQRRFLGLEADEDKLGSGSDLLHGGAALAETDLRRVEGAEALEIGRQTLVHKPLCQLAGAAQEADMPVTGGEACRLVGLQDGADFCKVPLGRHLAPPPEKVEQAQRRQVLKHPFGLAVRAGR